MTWDAFVDENAALRRTRNAQHIKDLRQFGASRQISVGKIPCLAP
jgi:hypothetical protein